MTLAYLLLAAAAASGFYLATAHQRFWPAARSHARILRGIGWAAAGLAVVMAIAVLGPWAGVFAALTTVMLGMVLLPPLDAWRQLRQGSRNES